jgi:RNA polymerase sigma-70 factor (ECF subfamily)
MNSDAQIERESDLITAILAGDIQLFRQLIRPYEQSVYNKSLSYMKNVDDAKDVEQETFVRAFRKLGAFRGDSSLSTWLISIALNEARGRLRRWRTSLVVPLDEFWDEERFAPSAFLLNWRPLPSELVKRKEIGKLIHEAVKKLPSIYQQVFILSEAKQLNVKETARILHPSIPMVKSRLHRARIMSRRQLAPKLKGNQWCIEAGAAIDARTT